VNANSHIGEGCIVSVGVIVDHDVEVGSFCHINAGAIVKAADSNDAFAKEHKEQTGKEVSFF
jgi:UDP-N-acetylbacillosamine N-acetyltransferase